MLGTLKNFFITLGNIFKKPRTVIYPKERMIIPEVSKGLLKLKLDLDSLEVICKGCGLCEKVCPQDCIKVERYVDDNGKESLKEFYLDISKCIFCGNCVEFCELNAIEMSYRYRLAEYNMDSFKLKKLDLIKQSDYSIRDFWLR